MRLGQKVETIDRRIIADNEQSPCEPSLLHPYPGSMPAFLAARLTERYSNKGDSIFDPFCGTGAVLVESLRLRRKCFGTDLLGSSVRIASAAVNLPAPEFIESEWERLRNQALSENSLLQTKKDLVQASLTSALADWFHPDTYRGIASLFARMSSVESPAVREVLLLVLAGSLASLSRRASRGIVHWGWIADNVIPKSGDLVYVSTIDVVGERIQRLLSFMKAANSAVLANFAENAGIFQHNWLSDDLLPFPIPAVDLLLTSPPYPYSIDYTLAMRLTHYLLGYDPIEPKEHEIGARFKRKRKDRTNEYLQQLGSALRKTAQFVKYGGFAVFVLPLPSDYDGVLNFGPEEWLTYIGNNLEGDWKLHEVGTRDCGQRRIVHPKRETRAEAIWVFQKQPC